MREEANAALKWIGERVSPPTDNIPSPRKRADFPQVFRHERTLANRLMETSRYVGGRLPTKVPSNSLGQRGGLGRIRSKLSSPMACGRPRPPNSPSTAARFFSVGGMPGPG